ncbi:MAG: aminopeptidase [Lachnospiraceae bacterium]|nr:aminopeptidase [Lachnospiraceae bacterium]
MTFEEKKEAYAKLIVQAGVHVRPGQRVSLSCPIEAYEFARLVVKYAYEAGAIEVVTDYQDDVTARLKLENAPLSVFQAFPEWTALEKNTYAKTDVAFIHLVGSDPDALKGVDLKKLAARRKAAHEALKEYYKLQSTMGFKWNVSAVPTKAWAVKVFPGENPDTAMTRLWNAIFGTVRIGDGDPYEKWMEHAADLAERGRKLNEWQFESLHYTNALGTDFTVGLVQNHRWEGGADLDKADGGRFFANMPTEEVFTMPHREKAEGVLKSALPLSYQGSLIEDFSLTFKDGKVVDFEARKGQEALQSLLDTDEGSRHLGECALVPYPSPVSAQGVLFLETLFDENAACHFALGNCYETNLIGGAEMSDKELTSHGANFSSNHVDFMVGTSDLMIVGRRADGEEITVFENGTWAF